ncbi:uncharacterized protein LOC133645835 isoform X3 [Entelurus aequoreus]|uniref:uncharacterized protein LOC133645835 isoform X3 n=1 Tax=Entelurus aequoreus TaxID=161455 RepID=UPI002B1DB9E7|nr:uncharacterized protein LOC133645835 isoform X3 [Entelurus aequoreus]
MDAAETASCTAAGADNAPYSGPDSDEPDENDADWRLIDHHVTLSSDSENESDSDCFEDHLSLLATEYHVKHNALDSLLKLLKKVFQMAPSFVVVEFLGERSVAVVPTIWTEDDGKNSFCYWPRPNPTHSRIRKSEIPDKEVWDRLPIRVFRKTLTAYFEILQKTLTRPFNTKNKLKCFRARKKKCQPNGATSPLNVIETMRKMCLMLTTKRKFGRKRSAEKRNHRSSSRHPHCQSSHHLTFQSPASTRPLQPVPANTRPLQGIQADLTAQREAALPGSVQTGMHPAQASTRPLQPVRVSTRPLQEAAGMPLTVNLNMKVQNILENQGEIMRMLRGLAAQSVGPEAVDVQDLIEKPFETLEQLKAFCERLDTDLLLRKQLVKALTALGGQNLADTVRTMLRKIATNKVLEQLGLRGKTGKVAFEDLPLYRIINSMQGCLQADDHS